VKTYPFESNKVIEEKICEAKLRVFDAGFDQNQYRLKPLADVIMRALPEFALGYNPKGTPDTLIYERLKEAAEILYKTDKYKSRGEFGELILHLLLRDFCGTIPLVSKIYFKDSPNNAVHGFDAIHVVNTDEEKSLWLGEAKIYQAGSDGLNKLVDDLKSHFTEDYLRNEFFLIKKKVDLVDEETIKDRDHWLDLMNKHTTIDRIFSSITIPMLCVYDSEVYQNHTSFSEEYLRTLEKEVREMAGNFHCKCGEITTNLNIILLLLPIPSKTELVDTLNERLKNLQHS
jgi:hypothetical protein